MNREELGQVIINSERQMYVMAKSLLFDEQDCYDAIQESIVKAFEKLNSLKKDEFAKTWLMRILINECHNIIRKRGKVVLVDDFKLLRAMYPQDKNDYARLHLAISRLKKDLKICIIMYYIEDFSIREIAYTLKVSEGAVQKRLARARKKLKEEIEKEN